jgi:regulator of protease activity HflC (stomatin/prohibitin superfamily)
MSDHTARNPIPTVIGFFILCLVAAFAILLIWMFFVATVPAGAIGIQDTFGSVHDDVLQPGFHLKSPFTSVNMMSTRTSKYVDYGSSDKATIVALSNDGMQTTMGIAVNFHINPAKAVDLYKNVGMGYMDIVMVNPIHSVPRDLISKYDTKTLYSASKEGSTDRAKLEQELYEGITQRLNAIGVSDSIVIEQVSIRDIDFPQVYKDSITSKMRMDTEIQQKELEVKKQQMEAQRVVAQAEGEANANIALAKGEAEANRIRTASLSPALLQYTWIQGMLNNNNTIYIPIDENGIPVMKTV